MVVSYLLAACCDFFSKEEEASRISKITLAAEKSEKPGSGVEDDDEFPAPPLDLVAVPTGRHASASNAGEGIADMWARIFETECPVQPWRRDGEFLWVRKIQDADRNYGRVDLMKRLQDGQMVAVKRMPTMWVAGCDREFQAKHPNSQERPWVDVKTLRYLNAVGYPWVCKFIGLYRDNVFTYVATSYAAGGDILKWCQQDILPVSAREARIKHIASQIFLAVRQLHDVGICHYDISCENILLSCGQVKLIDFAMSGTERFCQRARGKRSYQAPEMHSGVFDGFLSDAFAIGVVLFAMAYKDYPWNSTKALKCKKFAYAQANGVRALIAKRRNCFQKPGSSAGLFTDAFVDVVEGLTCLTPTRRMCLGEGVFEGGSRQSVANSPWLNEQGGRELRV